MQPIEIHNAEEYQRTLSSGIIEPGDIMYFSNKEDNKLHHATIITDITDNQIYYSGKSVERNNMKLDMGNFETQYISIVHMN